jgi:hypothetical protein
MYTFEKRDEGFLVIHENGRAVANVDTQKIEVWDHVDGDPKKDKLATPKKVTIKLPKPFIHFTAYRFTPGELDAFVTEVDAELVK